MDRAAERGGCERRRTARQRERQIFALARGCRHRRRQTRRHPRQRARQDGRFLYRAESYRMSALTDLTIMEAVAGLAAKKFTAVELTDAHIKGMEKARGLNAFVTETPELARKQAKESDARRAAGKAGAMDGIPIGIKDLFCTKGVRTTASSKILDNFVPTYESTVTQKLFDAGCVMLGKLNLDEFAMGSSTITSAYGPTINPWSGSDPANAPRKLVPGGSSGGSSAAVAARVAMAATGTDTGGSIRQPAGVT